MTKQTGSLLDLIQRRADANPKRIAILAPGRTELTYGDLALFVCRIRDKLDGIGLRRHDTIALVLPNGPEAATAFLATASTRVSAPLYPGCQESEFEYYLRQLNPKLILVGDGMDSPVRAAAARMRIPVVDLVPEVTSAAGIFTLPSLETAYPPTTGPETTPADMALLLHTSGTTSQPKIVPLTQANICASARHISETLRLTEEDRCLNVMPLFHIHGLIAGLMSSLAAGASVCCSPGYRKDRFFTWLNEVKPSWYTAVPTIHQSILSIAAAQREMIAAPLRFIRSSSAPMTPRLMRETEEAFNAPLIDAYGMTEATHQVTSNPLPPAMRKPRSVGLASGPEVAIMFDSGELCEAGQIGEVVIRGANVTSGYIDHQANTEAFTEDWFRTGDQGYLDDEGYLFLTGRLKDVINRGGEKVSPREIDEILMEHPEIAEAVGFAVPHPTLGEDVAVAVVLAEGSQLTQQQVRAYAFEKLADFKVPNQVLFVQAIPRMSTGKLQRRTLANNFATLLKGHYQEPETDVERLVAQTICDTLKVDRVGVEDNFFAIGGDSLTATQVVSRLNAVFYARIPIVTLFRKPTVRELACEISETVKIEEPELMEQLLTELEDMSEEEALLLLNK